MNEHKAIIDHQGFLEAAKAMDSATTVDLMNIAYHLEGTLSRVTTLLRALDHILYSGDKSLSLYKNDILNLVALAQEAIESPEKTFEQLECLHLELQRAFKHGIDERKHLNKIIDAFEVCTRPASLNEINQAAESIHELACSNPGYGAHWATFSTYMKGCGLEATMRPITPNGPLHVWVDYAEPRDERRKTKRKKKRAVVKAARAADAAGRAPA